MNISSIVNLWPPFDFAVLESQRQGDQCLWHADFDYDLTTEFADGIQTAGTGATIAQSTDDPYRGAQCIDVTLVTGTGESYLEKDLGYEFIPVYVELAIDPDTVSGGTFDIIQGIDGDDDVNWRVTLGDSGAISLKMGSVTVLSDTLDADWSLIGVMIKPDRVHLLINGVFSTAIGAYPANYTQKIRIGGLAKENATTGTARFDWISASFNHTNPIHAFQVIDEASASVLAEIDGQIKTINVPGLGLNDGVHTLGVQYFDVWSQSSYRTPIVIEISGSDVETQMADPSNVQVVPISAGSLRLSWIVLPSVTQTTPAEIEIAELSDLGTIIETIAATGISFFSVELGPYADASTKRLRLRSSDGEASGQRGPWIEVPPVVTDAVGPVSPDVVAILPECD